MTAAGLTLLGFFALASAMPRHAPVLLGRWATHLRPNVMQAVGWGLLLAAPATSLTGRDWPLALVAWFGMLPIASACVLLGLTYSPWLARGAAILGAIAAAAGLLR